MARRSILELRLPALEPPNGIARGVLAALGIILFASPAMATKPLFSSPFLALDVESRPQSVAVADFNGDGRQDLAVPNSASNTISILLANDQGGFEQAIPYPVGQRPFGVAVGDLDGDGKPDLATTNYDDGTVSVLLNRGNGTFQPRRDFRAGPGCTGIVIVDVDGDTKLDVAVAAYGADAVSLLHGTGDGMLGDPIQYSTDRGPAWLATDDVNGDGRPDLVTSNLIGGSVSVLLSRDYGGFGSSTQYAVGLFPYGLAVADLNRDGHRDVIVVNQGSASISVLLGDGTGGFGPKRDYATGPAPFSVAVGDLGTDGYPDVAVVNLQGAAASATTLSVFPGGADGTLGPRVDYRPGISAPSFVAMADVNADGKRDLVVTNDFVLGTVTILFGNGDGTVAPRQEYATGPHPQAVAIGDVNGDGQADAVTANYTISGPSSVSVLLGAAGGGFEVHDDIVTGNGLSCVAMADLDGDGKPDFVVGNYFAGTITIFAGHGDGTFAKQPDLPVGSDPDGVAIADLDADGKPDLVVANLGSGTVTVLLNQGNGSFTSQEYWAGAGCYGVSIGDLDRDGKPDVVVPNYNYDTVTILRGRGDGTLEAGTKIAVGGAATSVAIGDLNRDGIPDLAVSKFEGAISILLGHGDGTFGFPDDRPAAVGTYSAVIADLDRDGAPDVAAVSAGHNTVVVLRGNGDGTFRDKLEFGTGEYPLWLVVDDLNDDGWPDLVVANTTSGSISTLVNRGPPPPTLRVALAPSLLWPANHKLASIHADVHASSAGRPVDWSLVSLTSDEPDAGTSPQDLAEDVQNAAIGVADADFDLRAERADLGAGRTYTICYEARNDAGVTRDCEKVRVPRDARGRATLADDGGTWRLTIFGGDASTSVRMIAPEAVAVRTSNGRITLGATGAPIYSNVDSDRWEDATFTLGDPNPEESLTEFQDSVARWELHGAGYVAEIPSPLAGAFQPIAPPRTLQASVLANPARGGAQFRIGLPKAGLVRLTVFDVTGHVVSRPLDGWRPAGWQSATFDPRGGSQLYFYRAESAGALVTGKLAVLP